MQKTKRPLSFLLAVLMIIGMFASVPFTASAEDKVIGEGVIFKLGDTIVLPGEGTYYVKDSERHPAQRIYGNGTVTQFEGDEYSYSVQIDGWGIYAYLDTFGYWEEMEQGLSVLGITFTGSGTESDPYLLKLAFGEVESTWTGEGEGTEASPWLIKDLNDLRTLSANVASGMTYSGKYLKLAADIDCGSDNWEPIGGDKSFAGTFDGDGKTITYSIICSENDTPKGLFAKIGSAGTVKNLNVAGSIVNTAEYAGPAGGIAAYNSGLIENCYSAVDITKGCDRGTGGIAAYNEEGATIRYCAASGTLTWTDASDFYAYIGGITGENYNYNDEESEIKIKYVTNCAMLGDVLAQNAKDQYNYAGRLIGRQYDDTTSDDCYYLDTMTVTGVVNSDSVTAKTAEELKAIGQAAIDAGYTVYGLALGGSPSNPDQEAADAVIALIDAIGTVEYTDVCKAKIDAAREAYDDLTDAQQALVTNIDTLTAAETAYANLKAAADAAADPVSYLVWDDAARKLVEMTGDNACKTYTEVTADTATFEDGMWYVVNGEILNGNRITVTGTAHLILTDGSKLTTNNGINVANGSTLNIYGQGAGTGTVTANGGSNKGAGIGGKQNESGGTVNIYGGTVTATGSGGGAGIGGGWASVGTGGTGGTITIYGGTVTANGSGMGGAGIGGGTSQSAGIVTIYGGTVTANGNNKSPGIGPGANGDGGTLTVRGGSVTAVGATKANAINCTVMNTIPGTGWTNVNGTADETPIEINTEGQELTDFKFKKVQFLAVASIPNDQQAADAVIAKISAIGTVEYTADSKAKIDAAREAYDDLTDAQKELVTNSATLTAAETEYAALEAAATAAAALVTAKTNAKAELDSYKNADDYRDAQKTELANAIAAGKDAIDAAADTAAVATALANAKTAIDAIKTDAQLTAEEEAAAAAELATAKTNAKAELDSYKNADDYREAEQADLADAITAGKAAIDNAADTAAVAEALANAKTAIDAIKTDAELTAEEAANTVRIGSVDDWNSFAESVKNGNTYSGKTVLLTADVGPVTTMVEGTFSGTFDGDGYTLTVDISGGTVATFQNAANAVFQNFTLAGSVTGSGIHTGALVKSITGGTCSFKNVIVSANVNGAKGYVGGFVAHAGNGFTVSFKNCLYSGSINHTGTQGNFIGAFIGWSQNCTATIENCAFTGSYSNTKSFNNIGFSYNAPRSVTVSDFYSNASEVFVANVNRGTRLYTPGSYTSVEGLVINGDEWTFFTQYSDALSAAQSGGTLLMLDKAVTDAEALINAIGEVAYDDACKAKIDEARAAYDALTAEQQALVTNIGTLTDAETEYAALEAAAALAQAKTDAKDALETYKDLGDYREAQQNAVILEVTLGKSAIDAATTIADVNTALANAKTAIDAIKTDAELTAEEAAAALAQAKADAKAELANYKDPADYRPAQQTELTNAIAEGNEAIDAAADTDAVATALANAKAAIDAIKTDAQLTAEEAAAALVTAKADAKDALAAYKNAADYRPAQQTELTNAINAGNAAIDAATSTDGVATALENAKAAIDAIKTDAELTAEEEAAALVEKAKDWVSVRIDDQICINFLLAQRDDFESVKIEYIDQDLQTAAKTIVYDDLSELTIREGHYLIPVVIAPAQIGDTIKATLTVGGQEIEYTMSVKEYCEYLIANYDDVKVTDLAKATLEYGQAANDYFASTGFYNASEITTITEALKQENIDAAKAQNNLAITGDVSNMLAGASFMALTKPEFRFYFNNSLTDEKAVQLNENGQITTNVVGVTAMFYKNPETGAILLEVKGIKAEDMDKVITITVGDLGTITFSGNDFARMMANSSNTSVATLGLALYLYGVKAKECFA